MVWAGRVSCISLLLHTPWFYICNKNLGFFNSFIGNDLKICFCKISHVCKRSNRKEIESDILIPMYLQTLDMSNNDCSIIFC